MSLARAYLLCGVLLALSVSSACAAKLNSQGSLRRGLKWRALDGDLPALDPRGAPTEQWCVQPLDHFNPSIRVEWKQRYFVNETYFNRASGPVFILLGGEGPIDPIDVTGHFILNTYAQEFGALIVSVEHRFYGKSMPTPDLSVHSLQYLTTGQALADYAQFRQHIVAQYNLSDANVWVSFGGSYSGSLSAWFRAKYPTLVAGAIAASAPVMAQLNFPEYFEVVQTSIGPECAQRVKNVTVLVEGLLQSPGGRAQLQRAFNTCHPIASDDDVSTFMSSLSGGVAETVQYNNDNRQTFMNISSMCDILLTGSSDADMLASYVKFNQLFNEFEGASCTEASYGNLIKEMSNTDVNSGVAAARSWTWQTCIEYGYYQTGDSPNQPFSSTISLEWYLQQCRDIFGSFFANPNTQWVITEYGSNRIRSSNIVFPNGSIDPWHILGVLETILPSEPSVLIHGTAHCADLYAPSPRDLQELTQARELEVAQIRKWLAGDQC